MDDSDFVPELVYPSIALDFDDSSISVRFLTTAGFTPNDFNGFGVLDVDGEIGDFLVEDVQIVSGSVPRGMGLDDSVSPVEGSDVLLWNFVKDRTVRPDASLEAEFVIQFQQLVDTLLSNLVVKPGDDEIPSLNTKSKGVTPMALYGDEDFDASLVDPASILVSSDYDELLGGEGSQVNVQRNRKYHYSLEDINEDGFDDLVFKVKTQQLVNYVSSGGENQIFVSGVLDGDAFAATGAYLDVIG